MQNKRPMHELSNEQLMETYWTAIKLGLEPEFIEILRAELARRGIQINHESE